MTTEPAPRILVVEDEPVLREILVDNLEAEGFAVEIAADGQQALDSWSAAPPDLVVLDVMLPFVSGFDICERMRSTGDQTPVLFLSARSQPEDRVRGLKAGGDDYLVKPFNLTEFLLRVSNMLRRRGWAPESDTLSFAGHTVDFRTWRVVLADGSEEMLGEREHGVLRLLARHPNEVVSREQMLDEVWGRDAWPSSRTVDNVMVRLRRLFESDDGPPAHFHTVWGVGYRFTPEPAGPRNAAASRDAS